MRKYRSNAASDVRIAYGIEACAGLWFFPETATYAPSFESLNDDLDAAFTKRIQLRKPLLEKRAAFRFAQYETDQTIRIVFRAAEIADGGRKNGPIVSFLFPEGLGPVVAPHGTRQIPPTERLLADMKRCKVEGSAALCSEWTPKLEAVLGKLQSAASAHASARKTYADAFQDEVALRSEHYQAIDKLMGLVRATFPNDRVRQDLVFPSIEDGDGGDEIADGAGDGGTSAPTTP
jgi:hypothetical protein